MSPSEFRHLKKTKKTNQTNQHRTQHNLPLRNAKSSILSSRSTLWCHAAGMQWFPRAVWGSKAETQINTFRSFMVFHSCGSLDIQGQF